jgi:hypothetical protein
MISASFISIRVKIYEKYSGYYVIHTTIFTIFATMYKKIICYFLAGFFLFGNVVFPLGDFSLMRDIPKMYENYTKVTSDEEVGAIDFIGDYLLHGKDLFGHNEHDKVPAKGCDIQFQHQANPPNMIFGQVYLALFIAPVAVSSHPAFHAIFYSSDFRNKLFRPPLA